MVCKPVLYLNIRRKMREDEEFKVSLNYILNIR